MHVLTIASTLALALTLGWLAMRMWREIAPTVTAVLAREPVVSSTPPRRRSAVRAANDPVVSRRTNLPVPVAA